MSRHYILVNKEPVMEPNVIDWAKWFESADRQVGGVKIGKCIISTVFIGINHSFKDGPPLLFETMVFIEGVDCYMDRYSTWDDAVKGHNKAVEMVKNGKINK